MMTKDQLKNRIIVLKANRIDLEEQIQSLDIQLDGTKNEIAFLIGQVQRQEDIDNENMKKLVNSQISDKNNSNNLDNK